MKKLFETENAVINEISVEPSYGESRVFLEFNDVTFPNRDKDGNIKPNSKSFGTSFNNLFSAELESKIANRVKRMRLKRDISLELAGLLFTDAKIHFIVYEIETEGELFRNKPQAKGNIVTDIIKVTPNTQGFEEDIEEIRNEWFVNKKVEKAQPASVFANV